MNEAGKKAAEQLANNMLEADKSRQHFDEQTQEIQDWHDEAMTITLRHLAIYGPIHAGSPIADLRNAT